MAARTKPGSIANRVEALFVDECRRAGRGITIAEAKAAWLRAITDPLPNNFEVNAYSLAKRGVLVRTEGSFGHTRYSHHDQVMPAAGDPDDLLPPVYAAVCAAHTAAVEARRGPANVLTRDVSKYLRAGGLWVHPARLAGALRSLCQHRKRGNPEYCEPRLLRISGLSGSGQRTNWWRPVYAPAPAFVGPQPRSERDAVIFAVEETVRLLARPAEKREVGAWIAAHAESNAVAAALSATDIGRIVAFAQSSEAVRSRGYRVVRVNGRLNCHGGARAYFTVGTGTAGAVPAADARVCRVADAIYAYRPVEEIAGINALAREAREIDCAPLARLAALRRELLISRARAVVLDDAYNGCYAAGAAKDGLRRSDSAEFPAAVEGFTRSLRTVRRWIDATPGLSKGAMAYRKGIVDAQMRGGTALLTLASPEPVIGLGLTIPLASASTQVASVGTAALLKHDEVAEMAVAGGLLSADNAASQFLPQQFDVARRFPGAEQRRARTRHRFTAAESLSVLDRVDVLVCAHSLAALPGALALVSSAFFVMGHVLRDAAVLRTTLHEMRTGESWARRAIVVALGMLGSDVPLELGVADTADPLDIEAYVLCGTLVSIAHGIDAASLAYNAASSGIANDAADNALARLEAGDCMGVVG